MKQPTRRMSIGMTPAVLPPITAPVSNTPGGAIVGIPAVSGVWNIIAQEFTGDMKHNDDCSL